MLTSRWVVLVVKFSWMFDSLYFKFQILDIHFISAEHEPANEIIPWSAEVVRSVVA